jgi:hypothetical protein
VRLHFLNLVKKSECDPGDDALMESQVTVPLGLLFTILLPHAAPVKRLSLALQGFKPC